MKSILITGGAGFIGSNFTELFVKKYSEYNIIVLDKLTYAGNLDNLSKVQNHSNFSFIQGDICNKELLQTIFQSESIQGVIHFAAESHVDNSISDPSSFISTNIVGTFNLLETARKVWMEKPFIQNDKYKEARFLHISTDEVYGSLGIEGFFTELSPYQPNSPYSASKASSDMLVRSYFHTYGLNVVTTNCSNNYGPNQNKEKLIPTIIRKALAEEPIPIYGNGLNIRDWLYVKDHCEAIDLVFHKGIKGKTYLIGGNNEKTNLQIVEMIVLILDNRFPRKNGESYNNLITFVEDRPGHDVRYAIDSSKIKNELNWRDTTDFEDGLNYTLNYYTQLSK